MKASGGPVQAPGSGIQNDPALAPINIDFDDTQVAFSHKSDAELKHTQRLFKFMNNPALVEWGSKLGEFAVKFKLPFAEQITLATIYRQFVGGRTLLEVEAAARELAQHNVLSLLDYGAEGKNNEQAYNLTMRECIRAIEFAAEHDSIPIVTTKISGLASNDLLVALSGTHPLDAKEEQGYKALLKRVESLGKVANDNNIQLYIDAEESWMQPAIDKIVMTAMLRFNTERAVIVNTYQLYRHDRYLTLVGQHAKCRSQNVVLGAKLVRGAYMNKERARAKERGYLSPIHQTKEETDKDFNRAVAYCLDNIETIEFVNASHNQRSAQLMIEGMAKRAIARDHPHTLLCQLYGMSDNLTFNLAAAGYRVGKYLPYGPVADVVPYLVRRAQENTSITGEASRELAMITREIVRRQVAKGKPA